MEVPLGKNILKCWKISFKNVYFPILLHKVKFIAIDKFLPKFPEKFIPEHKVKDSQVRIK